MFKIGCHLSSAKGYLAMGKEAVKLGANTFQFFARNPRGSSVKPLDDKDIASYLDFAKENGLQPILAHAPYTLNPCAKDSGLRTFTKDTVADELLRLEHIPGSFYNLHPGNHVKQGVEVGIQYIIELLNEVISPEQSTTILLETMAGKGTEIGRSFLELRTILDGVIYADKIGVCLDTCHIFSAGYDIVNNLDGVLEDFDLVIGLDKLHAIHLNDSMTPVGSYKDRHEKIGAGNIGSKAFERIINHPSLCSLPFYLETPNDMAGYAAEIALLKSLYHEQ